MNRFIQPTQKIRVTESKSLHSPELSLYEKPQKRDARTPQSGARAQVHTVRENRVINAVDHMPTDHPRFYTDTH